MKKITTSAYVPNEIKVEKIDDNRVNISAYPFQAGFAVTVAHPLRRLLLSSTVGYAPTAIKIEGVTHEFDSMSGMLEDAALFIINLKNIRFKLKGDLQRVEVNYTFSGHKEIMGSDLENDDVEVVTGDKYLATINEDAKLNFSVIIEKGIGYVPSENIRDNLDEGYIALDAFFTPVRKAVYKIENVLVEDDPTYEKIIFTIETDGQVTPLEAFNDSIKSLNKQMSIFSGILDAGVETTEEEENSSVEIGKLLLNVSELNLSARSFNCLDRGDIMIVGELALMSENELKSLKNLGKKSFEEITGKMEELGYPVGTEFSEDTIKVLNKKIADLKSEKSEA